MHEEHGARERQNNARNLNAEGTAVGILAEEYALVGRTHDAPDDHRDSRDDTDAPTRVQMFDREQRQPQDHVLGPLDEWHGNTFADLTRVVDAKPLVREVAASVHHELWTEDATKSPPRDQRRHERVSESGERTCGPPSALHVEADGQGERDAPKARESALPHGDPASGVMRVVAPIGRDVGETRPE